MTTKDPFIRKPSPLPKEEIEEERVIRIVREWRKMNPRPKRKKKNCSSCL